MARPIKNTVEYFPHFAKGGRTVFILESKFGNDGYAFWFKLLEILCDSDRQVFDCSQASNMSYLLAKCRCSEETAQAIIAELVNIGKIDKELWDKERKIWVQNLVNNLEPIYKKRREEIPTVDSLRSVNPDTEEFPPLKPEENDVSAAETPQSKVKESKEENSKEKERIVYPYEEIVGLWNSICTAFPKIVKLTDNRRSKIKTRLGEFTNEPTEYLPFCETLFQRVQASQFLQGNNNHSWQASFDWLFDNGQNWVKVIEGNYDNKGGYHPAPTAAHQYTQGGMTLGIGEYIDTAGRRTYGTGAATIPADAPARPSERHYWNASTKQWTL